MQKIFKFKLIKGLFLMIAQKLYLRLPYGQRHLTEILDLGLWIKSLTHASNVSMPDFKKINKAP